MMAKEVHGPGVRHLVVDTNQDRCGHYQRLYLGECPKRRDRRWIEALVIGMLAHGEAAENANAISPRRSPQW